MRRARKNPATITPTQMESAKRRDKANKEKAAFRKATAYFRPKKAEKGTIVFLASKPHKGKRIERLPKGSTRKGYAVYVPLSGKKKFVPYKELTQKRQPPKAYRQSSVNIRLFNKKKAVAKWYGEILSKPLSTKRVKPLTPRGQVNYNTQIGAGIARDLRKVSEEMGPVNKTLIIDGRAAVTGADGKTRTIKFEETFKQSFKQRNMPPSFYKDYANKKVYRALAAALSPLGLVTKGSAAFVRRLKENRGKSRKQWTKGGSKWDKADFADVKIKAVDWTIAPIKVRKRNGHK